MSPASTVKITSWSGRRSSASPSAIAPETSNACELSTGDPATSFNAQRLMRPGVGADVIAASTSTASVAGDHALTK